ncbi:1750_t:CDS:2, partial [Acaulospora morrowiae]
VWKVLEDSLKRKAVSDLCIVFNFGNFSENLATGVYQAENHSGHFRDYFDAEKSRYADK